MALPGQDTRVVELRIPGLVGLGGQQLLDAASVVTVAGDEDTQLVRPADRLRRPAPGPVLAALRRHVPRTLEGYLWHGMTSGGPRKAAWALLFPFALVNVAHGMLPAPRGRRGARALAAALRALLRVIAVLLTVLFVVQLAVISLDMIVARCLLAVPAAGPCFGGVLPSLAGAPHLAVALGVLPLLLAIAVLQWISRLRWTSSEAARPAAAEATDRQQAYRAEASPGAGAPVRGALDRAHRDVLGAGPDAGALRGVHTVAALGALAMLLLGGPTTVPGTQVEATLWAAGGVLLGASLLGALALDGPPRRSGWLARLLGARRVFATLSPVAVLVVLAAGAVGVPLGEPAFGGVAGMGAMLAALGAAMVAACALVGLLLVPLAILARPAWRSLPRRLRPWLGGWAAAPTVILACLTGAGFGAGLAIVVRELIADRSLALPPGYADLTAVWGAGLILVAVFAVATYAGAIPLRRRLRGVPAILHLLHPRPGERAAAARAWASAIVERKHLHRLVSAVVLIMTAGALGLVAAQATGTGRPEWLGWLSALGVAGLGLLAAGLLRVVYTAARTRERNRHLGALADLVYFWPRTTHPVVPPSYALKVVPDVAERAREHLADPSARVVIAGYSHGGLLAVLAVTQLLATLDEQERARVGLLTAGSPLQWGYQRAFPGLLPHASLVELSGALRGRWRGLCRGTDPFGGGVTTWRHQVLDEQLLGLGYQPGGEVGPLPVADTSPTGALVLGGDHWLPDPLARGGNGRRWAAGVLGHADYLVDEEWDRAVAMAAGLERPGGTGGGPGVQATLFAEFRTPRDHSR